MKSKTLDWLPITPPRGYKVASPPYVRLHGQGASVLIELKSEKGHMNEAQHDMAKAINARGGWFAVIRSVDEAAARLKVWIRTAEMRAERRAA